MAVPRSTKMAKGTFRPCRDTNPYEPNRDCMGNPVGEPVTHLDPDESAAYGLLVTLLHPNTVCRSDALFLTMLAQDLAKSFRENRDPEIKYSVNHRNMLYAMLGKAGLTPSDRRKVMDAGSVEVNPFASL